MATGVTARERLGEVSISALDISHGAMPMPSRNAVASLSYAGKASAEDVKKSFQTSFFDGRSAELSQVSGLSKNSFILSDNAFVSRALSSEGRKCDLVYMDPPYGTGFDFQSRDLEHAYDDKMGQVEYLEFMRRRLILIRECMSDDASIYVHIGHQMLGHLKIIMDEVFGFDRCRNIITRRKCSSKNFTSKQYANINDYVLFYTKGKNYKWNNPSIVPDKSWIDKEYNKTDEIGRRFKLVPIHAPGTRHGATGEAWRGKLPPKGKHWQYAPAKLEELDRAGDIHWSKTGNPRRKVYLSKDKKVSLTDHWDMYRDAHHQSIRITGYPTEKNLDMLKMIVSASSDEGDLVYDPFCGSGTTLHASKDLGRSWIGVDASFVSAKTVMQRLQHGLAKMGDYVTDARGDFLRPKGWTDERPNFLVEASLAEAFEAEIRAIARI